MTTKVTARAIKKKIYQLLPQALQKKALEIYVNNKIEGLKNLVTPTALIFFITNRCNMKCAHCFYHDELNTTKASNELKLDEIEKIAASLKKPINLSLTGGEPFIRNDVVDICRVFSEKNGCRNFGLATNGYYIEKTVTACRTILETLPIDTFTVQISLDGMQEVHDEIRVIRHGFDKAVDTIKQLAELSKEYSNFSVRVSITIQNKNIDDVLNMVDYIKAFEVPVKFALVRGQHFGTYNLPISVANAYDPLESDAPLLDMSRLDGLFAEIKKRNDESDFKFWTERQQEKIRISLDMIKNKKSDIPCYAGKVDGVLYSDGEVALCELTKNVGNIRDFDLNFERVWNSEQANKYRKGITKCSCIHGCNLTTGMTFNPKIVHTVLMRNDSNLQSYSK